MVTIKKIDHVVITTSDLEKCIAFYTVIGFQSKNGDGRGELYAGDFKINVHRKGRELEPKAQTVQTGSADLCFEIADNIETLKVQLLRQGIPIELGTVERTGVRGAMYSIYLRDPDGNLVELCSYT